ncbi:lipase member H-A-like [Eupeodes corollae]|uniref:lipase member H-A-like n=1 Tax=Eupeodes corollae TaxID=290404 RepID=UPI00249283BD|nr:lipase member H-A-like [Eupeodes corollae]XP_055921926.1 lipase member H-A-like [Eupeodes corollae]
MKSIKIKSRLFLGMVKAHADLTQAKFVFFYGPNFTDSATFELDDGISLLKHEKFDKTKKTVLYVHGYLENLTVESIKVIVEAYLQRKDVNLIVLDWGELADGNYMLDAVVNAKQLGPVLAKKLIDMFDQGLDISSFHLIGHSLGGQMSGIVGREVYRRSKKTKRLRRITALDPAFPPFYTCITAHLNKKDADFVDVIHTDAWIYGAPISTGTADFWPNSGKTLQPGCPKRNYKMLTDNDLSSHRRSWYFWAESVAGKYNEQFEAVKTKNWNDFKSGKINEDSDLKVVMGHDCPINISGDYYLQTNGLPPYARGKSGTVYIDPNELPGNSPAEIAQLAKEFI